MQSSEPIRLSLARPQERPRAEPLFRPQAVEAAREPLHGEVTVVVPPGATAVSVVGCLALLLLALACYIVEVPQRARTTGVLMPPDGFMKIVAAGSGNVVEVNVREGERVIAGQPLLRLGSNRGVVDGGPVATMQLESLRRERKLAEDANRERQRLRLARIHAVDEQLRNLELRLNLVRTEAQIQSSRHELLHARFERLQDLAARGNVPAVQVDDEKLVLLQSQAAATMLQQQAAQLSAERDQLLGTRAGLAGEADAQQAEFAVAREQLQRQIAAFEAEVSRALAAPESGIVARINIRPGQAVHPGQTLMLLDRGNGELQAWLYLPSASAGLLQPGQAVELRFEAYPHQMFGTHPATVKSISSIALLASDVDAPLALSGPVFEVRATLGRQHVTANGKRWPLTAGTSFQADIVQQRYRLYEWLLRLRQRGEPTHPRDA